MSELIRQIALVSQSALLPPGDVSKVAAAIQKQATRDLSPIWSVSATVDAFDNLDDVPIGYWPLVVMDNINTPGASGIHEDNNGQPFALISASADLDVRQNHLAGEWTGDGRQAATASFLQRFPESPWQRVGRECTARSSGRRLRLPPHPTRWRSLFRLSISYEFEFVDVHESHVGDIEMRDHRQR